MLRITRVTAAVFVIVGGAIHYELWRTGYRGIEYIGPLFIANVAVSAVLVLAILFRGQARVVAGAMLFSVASGVALVMSRTTGLLGFTEREWTDMAVQATTAEIGAVVALALVLALRRQPQVAVATVPVRPNRWRRAR